MVFLLAMLTRVAYCIVWLDERSTGIQEFLNILTKLCIYFNLSARVEALSYSKIAFSFLSIIAKAMHNGL